MPPIDQSVSRQHRRPGVFLPDRLLTDRSNDWNRRSFHGQLRFPRHSRKRIKHKPRLLLDCGASADGERYKHQVRVGSSHLSLRRAKELGYFAVLCHFLASTSHLSASPCVFLLCNSQTTRGSPSIGVPSGRILSSR